jgi:maleate isomerase
MERIDANSFPIAGKAQARLGLVVPSINTVVEPWFNSVAPAGVAIHASRMLLDSSLTLEAVQRMDDDEGARAARQIADCRPDVIAYCCTASSIVRGIEYDRDLRNRLERDTGRPCFTAAQATIEALWAVGAQKIAVASPYPEKLDVLERRFFIDAGFQVLRCANLGIEDSFRLADPTPAELSKLAYAAWDQEADALLMTCLNTGSHSVAQALETALRAPVITSTQATLWKLLRTAGIQDHIEGYGRLLSAG